MKCVEKLKAQLEAVGATLDEGEERDGHTLNCDAPIGYVWRANNHAAYAIQIATNQQSWAAQAIAQAMPELKQGLEKVTDPEELAAIRWEVGDETWGAPADAPDRIEFPKAQFNR